MIPNDPSSLFSEEQRRILVILPGIAAAFSVIASVAIIYTLLVDPVERKSSPFQRILLAVTFMDLLFSGPHVFMGGWAVPHDDWVSTFARGNQTSCDLMGFLIILGVAGQLLYSASLAMYHVLVVRFRWKSATIARRLEPLLHCVSLLFPLTSAVVLLRTEFINSSHLDPGTCVASTKPPNCLQLEDVDCVRGHEWQTLHSITIVCYSIMVLMTWVIMITANVLLWLEVRSTERRMQRYGQASSRAASFSLTRKVGNQGMLYVACFTACNLLTLIRILVLYPFFETSSAHRSLYFTIQITSLPMLQLQGFFHAIVFFTPRWRSLLQKGRSWSALGRWMIDSSDSKAETSTELDQEIDAREIGKP